MKLILLLGITVAVIVFAAQNPGLGLLIFGIAFALYIYNKEGGL